MRKRHNNKRLVILAAIIPVVLLAIAFSSGKGHTQPPLTGSVDITGMSLMLPVLNTQNPQADINVLKPYLKSGDILTDGLNAQSQMIEVKQSIPGLKVGVGGTSIDNVPTIIDRATAGVDYITYDYEKDFTREFSQDQAQSIAYFDQLYSQAHAKGKQLVIVPVYTFGKIWDWGEVAKHTDIIVLQVQNFQTGAKVPLQYTPAVQGEDLQQVVSKIVQQVNAKSPSTKIYLQFDSLVTSDPNNILGDIETVKDLGIDGLTLWYNPGTSGDTSQLQILEQVLSHLKR